MVADRDSDGRVREDARTKGISRVLWQILVLNLGVSAAKSAWGLISGSTAMFADGLHSLADGSGNIVALVAMKFASKPHDDDHPYGHQKYESFASAVIGVMLILAAWRVASSSVASLAAYATTGALPEVEVTGTSFAVMLVTLAINIFVVWFETRQGKRLESDVLCADAKHTLSDIWVTLGVLVSLVLVKYGVSLADPVVGLFVAFAIAWAAIEVFKGIVTTFSDEARLDPLEVAAKISTFAGVRGSHNIRTRGTGAVVHMDMSVLVDPHMTVAEAHVIARDLEAWLCGQYPGLKDVVVHVEPDTEDQRARSRMCE
ncbi:MAG: cation diffusion facilitator family transporter [Coriobacteriia bacterium]|nr:cation diffusion facilitator family transporter [Coriobacteriia bacterium]